MVQQFKRSLLTMWTVTGIEDKTDVEYYLQEKPQQRKESRLCTPYGNSPLTYHKVAENVYLHLLNTSTNYVYIMTPYLIFWMTNWFEPWPLRPDEVLMFVSLCQEFRINSMPFDIATTYFKALLEAGVRIFRYTPGFAHAKFMFLMPNKLW